jgi:hypothetical protein
MKRTTLILTAFVTVAFATMTKADGLNFHDLSPEEQALYDKGAYQETYDTSKHSGHEIDHITATSPDGKHENKLATPEAILSFNFGMEDAAVAREEGRNMAQAHYTPALAHEFLFAEGWDKYHDRFFTRCYFQEGQDAYEQAMRHRK